MLPFDHVRVLDFSRQAPGPFATMVLADFGADVTMVEPPPGRADQPADPYSREQSRFRLYNAAYRGKRSIILDLRLETAREVARRLARHVDVVIEGFRPGVADRLGIGWERLHGENPRLIYCSVSGYGQDGPERLTAGHDINYIARAGALGLFTRGDGEPPVPPLNVLGDYAGGGLLAAFSIAAALAAREKTGEGQLVDVSMTDGAIYLLAMIFGGHYAGGGGGIPGGFAAYAGGRIPHYNVYRAKDGRWLSVGAEEPHFWRALCEGLGRPDLLPLQHDESRRSWLLAELEATFATRTAAAWLRRFRGTDACVEPVLSLGEAMRTPLARARGMAASIDGPRGRRIPSVGVGPKLSATPGRVGAAPPLPGADTVDLLRAAGYPEEAVAALLASGAAPAARRARGGGGAPR